jgi:hypothetical protein
MGRSTKRTACVEVDVDFDFDDFDTEDIVEYLEDKGYTVMEGINHSAYDNFADIDKRIWELYLIYKSDQGASDVMDKALGSFFADYYNKVSV